MNLTKAKTRNRIGITVEEHTVGLLTETMHSVLLNNPKLVRWLTQ